MFVLLKGRTVKDAFRIGQEIVSAVNEMNPNPVALKMEKVYHPCFLLTKKRYVGYSYESPDQIEPLFDAKGIETVRRDTCGAVAKTMEQSLRIYFEQQDISKVKCCLFSFFYGYVFLLFNLIPRANFKTHMSKCFSDIVLNLSRWSSSFPWCPN